MHIAFERVRRKTSPAAVRDGSGKCLLIYWIYHKMGGYGTRPYIFNAARVVIRQARGIQH